MKFFIWTDGDPDTGIPGDRAVLETDVDNLVPTPPDREMYIQSIKDALEEAFNKVWDFPVHVATEDELKNPDPEEQ